MSGWVGDVISSFGARGLAALMVLENLFPPIPSEVVLPLAGFLVGWGAGLRGGARRIHSRLARQGPRPLRPGPLGGRGLVLRYGAVLRVKEVDLERAEGWFGRYDDAVVHFGKMVPGCAASSRSPPGC